jgi:hypothetical protein
MARKRQHSDQELPFVALMDTMTNVVGVLTIVMVVMGISLARAASMILSALPPATPQEVAAAAADLERLRAEQAPAIQRLQELSQPAKPADLAAEDARLTKLNRDLEQELQALRRQAPAKAPDPSAEKTLLAKREAALALETASLAKAKAERDALLADLEKVAAVPVPPAKVVRIPQSRPVPKDAVIERVLVTANAAVWIDDESVKREFIAELSRPAYRSVIQGQVKKGATNVPVFDHLRLVEAIAQRKLVVTRHLAVEVGYESWSGVNPVLMLRPVGQIPSSSIESALWRIKNLPKSVVMFHVTADGFRNYLDTRDIADRIGLAAGWDYAGAPVFKVRVGEVLTNRVPPPVPPPAKADPKKVEIKPPAPRLD